MNELNKTLRQEAVSLGLCQQWQTMWEKEKDIDDLLIMYKRGIDFCIVNDYPNLDYIRSHFDKDDLRRYGIFLDDDLGDTRLESGEYVFLGDCKGCVRFDFLKAVKMYVRHNSKLKVIATMNSTVECRVYDNADVESETDGERSTCAVVRVAKGKY